MITMDENNTMTFVCAELSSSMFQKLYDQKKSNRFCDLTLFVNNKIIKAHRNVLACSSPYFDSILKHHKILREQLIITCLDSDIFNIILNYMYTGEITIEHSNVEELLKLADHFIITKVIEYCIEFLGTKLNLDNCLFTYFLTQRFKLKHLGNIVENWIVSHLDEICDGIEIVNLNPNELIDFFKNKNFLLTTGRALNVLSQWMLHDLVKREIWFDKLIKCFNTNNFEPVEVFKHLDTCILYNKSELSMYKFLDYLLQNNWMLSHFKNRYDNLHIKYGQLLPTQIIDNHDFKSDKIIVTEKNDSNSSSNENSLSSVFVKAKLRNKKQLILKRLMLFGLKPSLRMAAFKMLTCKKKNIILSDEGEDEEMDDKSGIKCPICFTIINDSLLLEQHLALSHAKDVTYKCGICSFVCQYHGDYLNHMKTHFSGPPYKCDYCEISFDQISKLISHRAQHLDESIFQCTFCSFKCRLKQNFVSHLKIHTPDKLFKCEHCTKSFRFKQNLDTHMVTHGNEEKNLSCESCGFNTKFLSHMIAHKRIHAAKKNQFMAHSKSHNGVRPHSCTICGRGFMEKSHLVRHERIHLEEKPFKCTNCDYASSRRDKLKEHFTRHHGENASAKVPYKARPMRNTNGRINNNKTGTSDIISATTTNNSNGSNTTTNNNNTNNTGNNGNSNNNNSATNNNNNNNNNVNFGHANNTNSSGVSQPLGNDIQDLIMHHQNHVATAAANNLSTINTNYHHFTDPTDFHHHNHHNIHNQLLQTASGGHNQRSTTTTTTTATATATTNQHHHHHHHHHHNNNIVNHHMLGRTNHSTTTSTAAAVAAAMMLDPRFHHNTSVPYHPTTPAVSMAMAAVQSSQQIQNGQHTDYPPSLQNCMTLF